MWPAPGSGPSPPVIQNDDPVCAEASPLPKKPNYRFDKRRRELDKKQKKEEKQLRKLEASKGQVEEPTEESDTSPPD